MYQPDTRRLLKAYQRFKRRAEDLVDEHFSDVPHKIIYADSSCGGQVSPPQSEKGIGVKIFIPTFSTYKLMGPTSAEVELVESILHEKYHIKQFREMFNGPPTQEAKEQLYAYLATSTNDVIYQGCKFSNPKANYHHNPMEIAAERYATKQAKGLLMKLHPTFREERIEKWLVDEANLNLSYKHGTRSFFHPSKGKEFKSYEDLCEAMDKAYAKARNAPIDFSKRKCDMPEPISDFLNEPLNEAYAYAIKNEKSGARQYMLLASIVLHEQPWLADFYSLLKERPIFPERVALHSKPFLEYRRNHLQQYPQLGERAFNVQF